MTTVWRAMRPQLRRRWTVTVALVLLVGLAGGAVLAALAGASRTNTAMDRFVAYSRPEDVYVVVNGAHGDPSDPAVVAQGLKTRRRVLALPQIAAVGRSPYIFMSPDRTGAGFGSVNSFAAADAQVFRRFDRPLLLKGRLADPQRADEAVVDDGTAAEQGWHVGSQVKMWSYTTEQNDAVAAAGSGKIPAPAGPSYTFTIVGIVREPTTVSRPPIAVVRDAIYKGEGGLLLTPAFLQRFADDRGTIPEALPGMEGFRVRFRQGLADLGAFERGVSRIVQPGDGETNVGSDIGNAASASERALHLEAIALLAFAGLAAAAAVLVLGPPLSRHVLTDAGDNPTLAALGMDRRQLGLIPLARASIISVAGAAVAVAVAIALSPLTPIGLARRAEIHPGVSVNLAVLAFGFLAVALVVLIRTMFPAWRASRVGTRRSRDRPSVRPGPLTGTAPGLGPAAMAGVAMSFERGRGFGLRTALLGIVVAVAGVIASLTFGASLRHLVDTPREQGWNWDVIVGNPNSVALAGDPAADALHQRMVQSLTANRYVGAFAGFAPVAGATVDGRPADLVALDEYKGSAHPFIIEGRPALAADEIVLGRDVLDEVHKRVGDRVTLAVGDRTVTMSIVGASLQPTAGDETTRLSGGGAVRGGVLTSLGLNPPVVQFVVSYRPGVDREAALRSLLHDFGRSVLRPYPGGEVGDLARVDYLPFVLAALLVVLALGALFVTLVGSLRRHGRDLAVLKTLGFVRVQVWGAAACQATTLAVTALVVGVPGRPGRRAIGLAAGRGQRGQRVAGEHPHVGGAGGRRADVRARERAGCRATLGRITVVSRRRVAERIGRR